VHLVGFIIRIYHDARSPVRLINEHNIIYGVVLTAKTITNVD